MLKFCSQKKRVVKAGPVWKETKIYLLIIQHKKRQRNRCLKFKVFQTSNRHFMLFYF